VAQIGGDKVDLTVIMPPGTDPHTYKPTTKDLGDVKRAKRVFYNGLHLEGKMVELFEEKLKESATAVTDGIAREKLLPWKAGEGGTYDPHVWFDVTLWTEAGRVVKDKLAADDPANAAFYAERYTAFVARMEALDQYAKERVASIPAGKNVLITSHDAFNYYGGRAVHRRAEDPGGVRGEQREPADDPARAGGLPRGRVRRADRRGDVLGRDGQAGGARGVRGGDVRGDDPVQHGSVGEGVEVAARSQKPEARRCHG
jgi:hypothetical protein